MKTGRGTNGPLRPLSSLLRTPLLTSMQAMQVPPRSWRGAICPCLHGLPVKYCVEPTRAASLRDDGKGLSTASPHTVRVPDDRNRPVEACGSIGLSRRLAFDASHRVPHTTAIVTGAGGGVAFSAMTLAWAGLTLIKLFASLFSGSTRITGHDAPRTTERLSLRLPDGSCSQARSGTFPESQ